MIVVSLGRVSLMKSLDFESPEQISLLFSSPSPKVPFPLSVPEVSIGRQTRLTIFSDRF